MLVHIKKCNVNVIELSFHILYCNRKAINRDAANLENYRVFYIFFSIYPLNIYILYSYSI